MRATDQHVPTCAISLHLYSHALLVCHVWRQLTLLFKDINTSENPTAIPLFSSNSLTIYIPKILPKPMFLRAKNHKSVLSNYYSLGIPLSSGSWYSMACFSAQEIMTQEVPVLHLYPTGKTFMCNIKCEPNTKTLWHYTMRKRKQGPVPHGHRQNTKEKYLGLLSCCRYILQTELGNTGEFNKILLKSLLIWEWKTLLCGL